MSDTFNPDFNAPEIGKAIDAVAAQKTAEVISYFQKVAQVAVLAAVPEGDREKVADDRLTKIASGKLPGAMLASVMMSEVTNNKEASLRGAADVAAMRVKIASASAPAPVATSTAKDIVAKKS